jgi:adenosylcobinamide-GDP ribazoletransferase
MKRAAEAALCAFAYFSVIPMGRFAAQLAPDALALSFLPLVGIVVGAISGLAGYGAFRLAGAPWQAVTAISIVIFITGAVHVDGFLDCCDGLLASATPQRRLEILKDPRHGTFAIAGMAVLTLVWFCALERVTLDRFVLSLLFASLVSRVAILPNVWMFPYARSGAMARTFETHPSLVAYAIFLTVAAILAFLLGVAAVVAFIVAHLCAWLGARFSASRLGGGLTGDVYGALVVISETAALLCIATVPR